MIIISPALPKITVEMTLRPPMYVHYQYGDDEKEKKREIQELKKKKEKKKRRKIKKSKD